MSHKVLITGGAGYVGTSLIPALIECGHRVKVFDSLLFGGDAIIPFFALPGFEFMRGDVRDLSAIQAAVAGCDVIVHLAAIVGYPACRANPRLAQETNVEGSQNVAAVSDGRLVLFGSTGSNYGAVESVCTEDTPLNPLSLYGQTKTKAESLLLERANAVAFRFATAFGLSPRLRLDLLVNDFAYRAFAQKYLVVYESGFMRTFVHVRDMARAFGFAINHADAMRGQTYNVGSDAMNYSKRQVCELIQEQVPCSVHYADVGTDEDKRDYAVSYEKIGRLGYTATVSLRDGIAEMVRAFPALTFRSPYSNA